MRWIARRFSHLLMLNEKRNFFVDHVDHTPRPGEVFEIDGERWRVVEWTDRIECELLANWTTEIACRCASFDVLVPLPRDTFHRLPAGAL